MPWLATARSCDSWSFRTLISGHVLDKDARGWCPHFVYKGMEHGPTILVYSNSCKKKAHSVSVYLYEVYRLQVPQLLYFFVYFTRVSVAEKITQ